MNNLEELTISVDADVYREVSSLCAQVGTTIEILTESFIRYSADPSNRSQLKMFIENSAAPADRRNLEVIEAVFKKAIEESMKRGSSTAPHH